MKRLAFGMTLIALLGLTLTACGGTDEAAATEIEAAMKDFEFNPDLWRVAAGEEISIELSNDGSVVHEWVLLRSGVRIAAESELPETEEELLADFVYWEDEVDPGDAKTSTFTAPPAGTYQVICAIQGHFAQGMEGELISE